MENDDTLGRPVQSEPIQGTLFDIPPDWKEHWRGMPEFVMKDAQPQHTISVNFMSSDDLRAFADATGLPVSTRTDSIWYPYQEPLRAGEFYYDGPQTDSRYPVCIPSKGRAELQKTGIALERMGVTHRFFVEQIEAEAYRRAVGEQRVVALPFSDLGQGSIPARNFIWDWAKEHGHKRHWVVDDNISSFTRTHNNRRLRVFGGGFFRAMEDFVDRYENVVMAGPHDQAFVQDRNPNLSPIRWNRRVYSCILLDTSLPDRWRGRYNEDTDLSLRLMKQGLSTAVFTALCMDKLVTSGGRGKAIAGGNTDTVYATEDHRLAFAQSLKDQHPDVVSVVWRFNRWHHHVDYTPFNRNLPIFRKDYVPRDDNNNYEMTIHRRFGEKSDEVSTP